MRSPGRAAAARRAASSRVVAGSVLVNCRSRAAGTGMGARLAQGPPCCPSGLVSASGEPLEIGERNGHGSAVVQLHPARLEERAVGEAAEAGQAGPSAFAPHLVT